MSWCSDAPEDEAISLFAGLLANPDVRLSPLAFGSSNHPMCVLAPQKCAGPHGRAQKLCCFMAMLSMQPCIESGTLSLRKRASGTVKVFS